MSAEILNHKSRDKKSRQICAQLFSLVSARKRPTDFIWIQRQKSDFKIIFHRRHINNWDVCRWHLTAIFGKCYKADEKETPGSVYHMKDKVKIFFWHPENYSPVLIKREKRRKLILIFMVAIMKRGEQMLNWVKSMSSSAGRLPFNQFWNFLRILAGVHPSVMIGFKII